jgi:hypothetical protein
VEVLDFLTYLYDQGLKYSALNTARAALSSFVILDNNVTVGKHPLIQRFLKAVYLNRPTLPRYSVTWDVLPVLNFLRTLFPLDTLSLRSLTFKLVMLIGLITGQRCQSIHLMDLNFMINYQNGVKFLISEPVKQTAPGKEQPILVLPKYEPEEKLCVVSTLRHYISKTESLRQDSRLFISFTKPHAAVSKATVARWIKTVMTLAGVDTSVFKAHSVRAASTSKAKHCFVPVQQILKTAGWSNAETFERFYHRPVQNSEDAFAAAVLS